MTAMHRDQRNAEFAMKFGRSDDHVVVHVHGEVDGQTAPLLRERLRDLIENQGNLRVAVNLRDMTFIDSIGLAVLVDMHQAAAARGGTFLLESPAPRATRVFEIVGLDRLLVINALTASELEPDVYGSSGEV